MSHCCAGRGAGAEQVFRALLALVELRIDVERAAPVDDRVLDRLPHRAGDAAQHHVDLSLLDQPAHIADGDLRIRSGIFQIELDGLAKDAAALVDFLNRKLRDLPVGIAGARDRAGDVGRDAHLDRTRGMAPRGRSSQPPAAPPIQPEAVSAAAAESMPRRVTPITR